MKIIDNRNNTIFAELNVGTVFVYPSGKIVLMKTNETEDCNCVNLTNGNLLHISGDDFVVVVNATLTLEG